MGKADYPPDPPIEATHPLHPLPAANLVLKSPAEGKRGNGASNKSVATLLASQKLHKDKKLKHVRTGRGPAWQDKNVEILYDRPSA